MSQVVRIEPKYQVLEPRKHDPSSMMAEAQRAPRCKLEAPILELEDQEGLLRG